MRPVDLLPVIRAAVESQRPASDARQIRLQMVLDERAGMVSGDSERIQQVMSNLLSNAIKFTPKGGSVQVTLGRAESDVEIAVTDSGIGMEPAFLPQVFEPFQQAVDGTMRRHGGLGLGLSIVHHIVELHGGEIGGKCGRGTAAPRSPSQLLVHASRSTMALNVDASGTWRRLDPEPTFDVRLDGQRVLAVEDRPDRAGVAAPHARGSWRDGRTGHVRLESHWKGAGAIARSSTYRERHRHAAHRRVRLDPSRASPSCRFSTSRLPAVAVSRAYARDEDRDQCIAGQLPGASREALRCVIDLDPAQPARRGFRGTAPMAAAAT